MGTALDRDCIVGLDRTKYAPVEQGADSGTVRIESNDLDDPLVTVSLVGVATPPTVSEVGPRFLRGDSNDDGLVDLSDAVSTLEWLFLDGEAAGCLAAADANGDNSANIGDPMYTLFFAFAGGLPPVEPFPTCGTSDLEADQELGCETPPKNCP